MKTTIRNLRKVIAEQAEYGMKPSLYAFEANGGFHLQLVPRSVDTGEVVDSEVSLIRDSKGNAKACKSNKTVYSFAERYGIEARYVRFGSQAL